MKIFVSGNYLIIEDVNGKQYQGSKHKVTIKRATLGGDILYFIQGVKGFYNNPIRLSESTDQAGAAYTEAGLSQLLNGNTGDSSFEFISQAEYDSITPDENKFYFLH